LKRKSTYANSKKPNLLNILNSRSEIHIPFAHLKYHDKERSRLKKAYEILPESVAMPL
jgi:hypothetical protein